MLTSATLTPAQRLALELAAAERWPVVAEASDGSRRQLRGGRRGYTLVLYLAGALPPLDLAELYPPDDTPPPPARHPRRRAA